MHLMKTHFELDSSSLEKTKRHWLHDALQEMSIEQLDFFFRCVYEIVWSNNSGNTFGYGASMLQRMSGSIVGSDPGSIVKNVQFYTNRIERKFCFSFDCNIKTRAYAYNCKEAFEDIKFAIMYLACGKTKRDFADAFVNDPPSLGSCINSCLDEGDCRTHGTRLFNYLSNECHNFNVYDVRSKFNEWRKKLWKG